MNVEIVRSHHGLESTFSCRVSLPGMIIIMSTYCWEQAEFLCKDGFLTPDRRAWANTAKHSNL